VPGPLSWPCCQPARYERAVADFVEAIRTQPGWGFRYDLLADAYEEIAKTASALADYREALAASHYDEVLVEAALRKLGAAV